MRDKLLQRIEEVQEEERVDNTSVAIYGSEQVSACHLFCKTSLSIQEPCRSQLWFYFFVQADLLGPFCN